jgi:hypothetical protein
MSQFASLVSIRAYAHCKRKSKPKIDTSQSVPPIQQTEELMTEKLGNCKGRRANRSIFLSAIFASG